MVATSRASFDPSRVSVNGVMEFDEPGGMLSSVLSHSVLGH
jgi:hypothetical protein